LEPARRLEPSDLAASVVASFALRVVALWRAGGRDVGTARVQPALRAAPPNYS
jgi:hypothetical protein